MGKENSYFKIDKVDNPEIILVYFFIHIHNIQRELQKHSTVLNNALKSIIKCFNAMSDNT